MSTLLAEEAVVNNRLRLFIVGAGGHAAIASEIAELTGYEICGFFDDEEKSTWRGCGAPKWQGQIRDIAQRATSEINAWWFCAVGDNKARRDIVMSIEAVAPINWVTLTHPRAVCSIKCVIECGCLLGANAVIQINCRIGKHAVVNTLACVDHDCIIKDFTHVAPRACLCGGISVGMGTLIGAGAVVLPKSIIHEWVTVGAGSVVLCQEIAAHTTVVGIIKKIRQ